MSTCAVPVPVDMWITAMSPDPHEAVREPALDLPDEPPIRVFGFRESGHPLWVMTQPGPWRNRQI